MKRNAMRTVALILLGIMLLGLWAPSAGAAVYAPSVTLTEASNISSKGAQLNAYVSCPQRLRYDNVGFYISTDKNNVKAHRSAIDYTPKTASFALSFTSAQVKNLYGSLNSGTIYYYKLFVVVGGEEYASPIGWFRTTDGEGENKSAPRFATYDAAEVTMDSALLRGAIVKNPVGLSFTKVGLMMGTSKNAMSEVISHKPASSAMPQMYYNVRDYKRLMPLTTYYYQFFAVTKAGASYVSDIKCFTTLAPYHTVTFQPNGGMLTQMSAMIVYPGQPYAFAEIPVRQGFSFAGWYTLPNGGSRVPESGIWMYDADVTLYAMWTQGAAATNGLLVYFDLNYDNLGATESKTVIYGKKYGTLPEPVRTGYTFEGWYTEREGGARVKSSTKVGGVGSQTLFARWSPAGARVKFNANGGTVSPSEAKLSYGVVYTLPVPVRNGYAFLGWNTAKDGSGTTVTSNTPWAFSSKLTIYAQWAPIYGAAPQSGEPVYMG